MGKANLACTKEPLSNIWGMDVCLIVFHLLVLGLVLGAGVSWACVGDSVPRPPSLLVIRCMFTPLCNQI